MNNGNWMVRTAAAAMAAAALAAWMAGCGKASPDRELARGIAALSRGELLAGRDACERALAAAEDPAAWPEAPAAYNWLGLADLSLGLTNEAIAAFGKSLELKADDFTATYNLGCVLLDAGDRARGIQLLRHAADLDGNDIRALLKIGDWTTRNGRWDLARRMYFEAQKRSAKSAEALVGLGRLEQLDGRHAEAETYYMNALEVQPGHAAALYNLGVLCLQDPAKAEQGKAHLERYRALHGEGTRADAAARRLGGEEIPQASFATSAPAAQPKPAAREWSLVQESLQAGDRDAAYDHALRALDLAAGGDSKQLSEMVRRALEAFPDKPAVLLAAAQYHAGRADGEGLAEARDLLMRAQTYAPEDPMVLFELARVSSRLGEHDATVLTLKQLIRLEPGNPDALWEMAETYGDRLGMTSRGIAAYADFRTRFPTDPRAGEAAVRIQALEAEAAAAASGEDEADAG
jgi:tetratricopeptide (TPR) repeat protein